MGRHSRPILRFHTDLEPFTVTTKETTKCCPVQMVLNLFCLQCSSFLELKKKIYQSISWLDRSLSPIQFHSPKENAEFPECNPFLIVVRSPPNPNITPSTPQRHTLFIPSTPFNAIDAHQATDPENGRIYASSSVSGGCGVPFGLFNHSICLNRLRTSLSLTCALVNFFFFLDLNFNSPPSSTSLCAPLPIGVPSRLVATDDARLEPGREDSLSKDDRLTAR